MKTQDELLAEASAMFEKVTTTVKTESVELATKTEEVIKQEVTKLNAAVNELKRRGKCSVESINVFVKKCINSIKESLYGFLGKCVELWKKLVAVFNRMMPDKQLSMNL